MLEKKVGTYLETHILTTPKPQLLLMLLEKFLSLCEESITLIANENIEEVDKKLQQAQAILLELVSAIDEKMDEKIKRNLKNLYLFSYRQLVVANLEKDARKIEEARKIISIMYDSFKKAIQKDVNSEQKLPGQTIDVVCK